MNLTETIPNHINIDCYRQIVFTLASGQETVATLKRSTIVIDNVKTRITSNPGRD